MSNEEFVRANWERAEACPEWGTSRSCISLGGRGFTRLNIPQTISGYSNTESEAWAAAAEVTRQRLREIGEIEEEISLQEWSIAACEGTSMEAGYKRTLVRLQSALADLKRGMR